MRLSQAFWAFFERTGSVVAYLLYCHYLRVEIDGGEEQVQ